MYFCNGGFDCYKWNLCSHAQTFIPKMEKLLCSVKNFSFIHCFYSSKTWGQNNEIYAVCTVFTIVCHIYKQPALTYVSFIDLCVSVLNIALWLSVLHVVLFLQFFSYSSLLYMLLFIVAHIHDVTHILLCSLFHCNEFL